MFKWFRRPNWLGETWKQEMLRRIEANESSIAEFKLQANAVDNRLITLENQQPGFVDEAN